METYNHLPAKVYDVCFNKMQGFYLISHHDFEVLEEKVYGAYQSKIDKVLKGFELSNRNFGVILSGPKGVGKSLFVKLLSIQAREKNLPVVIISGYIPGIADFISSIEQEVVVLFDEFEKSFRNGNDMNPQDEMLSLFDGLDCGKKLFVVTCNEVDKLSSYLLNRPGRFHYHFILGVPSPEEIREYLSDKLLPEYHDLIDKVVNFSAVGKITYDCLRAIAFELNQGYSLEETVNDLNIARDKSNRFDVIIEFMDGFKITSYNDEIDVCKSTPYGRWYRGYKPNTSSSIDFWISFNPNNLVAKQDGLLVLDGSKIIECRIDESDFFDMSEDEQKKWKDKCNAIKSITLKRFTSDYYKYSV